MLLDAVGHDGWSMGSYEKYGWEKTYKMFLVNGRIIVVCHCLKYNKYFQFF